MVDLEHRKTRRNLRPALREAVEPGAKNHILGDPAPGLFDDEVFDEARASHNRRAKRTRELRVHVPALTPSFAGSQQFETDRVFEHMRRGVGFHMQRAP
jgi:hypothetical protein